MARKGAGHFNEAKALEQKVKIALFNNSLCTSYTKANEWLAHSVTASSTVSLDHFSVRKHYKQ